MASRGRDAGGRPASSGRPERSADRLAQPLEVVERGAPPLVALGAVAAPRAGRVVQVVEVGQHAPGCGLTGQAQGPVADVERREPRQLATCEAAAEVAD